MFPQEGRIHAYFMHLEYLHSKEAVTANNMPLHTNSTFLFLGSYMVPSTKKWRYRNKPGTNFAICTHDERIRIICFSNKNSTSKSQKFSRKTSAVERTHQDIGYNCIQLLWVELSIQKMRTNFIILSRKKTCEEVFSKNGLGNWSCFGWRNFCHTCWRLQLKLFCKARQKSADIIIDNYEISTVANTFLKTDLFATITVLKSVKLKWKTTKKIVLAKKKYSALAFQNFIENSDWRHFDGAVTRDMITLDFQWSFERALALYAAIKVCYIRKYTPKCLLQEQWLCEKTIKQFSRISDVEIKNDLFCQKEKQLFSSFRELNGEKARWNFIQDLRNEEKTQTRIESLLNSFGNKITKPMEIASVLNLRVSTLREFFGLQQTNNIPPKNALRTCFEFQYITSKETDVIIDSLHTSKHTLSPS